MKKKLTNIVLTKAELDYIVGLLIVQEAGLAMFKNKKKEREKVAELLDRLNFWTDLLTEL